MCVCYRNPNHRTNLNEILHEYTPQWGEGLQVGFDPYPNPQGQGGPKQGLACLCRLKCSIWQKLYKTKVVGRPSFSGGRSHFWICNLDLEGPGPHVLLDPW
jgi:hypothetical protein